MMYCLPRTLLFAAMDTTSSSLARTLQLLSERLDVQERLRCELQEACHGEDLGYDELLRLPYLDAICRETLRLCVLVQTCHPRTQN